MIPVHFEDVPLLLICAGPQVARPEVARSRGGTRCTLRFSTHEFLRPAATRFIHRASLARLLIPREFDVEVYATSARAATCGLCDAQAVIDFTFVLTHCGNRVVVFPSAVGPESEGEERKKGGWRRSLRAVGRSVVAARPRLSEGCVHRAVEPFKSRFLPPPPGLRAGALSPHQLSTQVGGLDAALAPALPRCVSVGPPKPEIAEMFFGGSSSISEV